MRGYEYISIVHEPIAHKPITVLEKNKKNSLHRSDWCNWTHNCCNMQMNHF